jgi:hypothetical protein
MRSSNTSFSLRRWWRRHAFYLRRLSVKWIVFVCVCMIVLIRTIPNPFSSEYERIFIDQNVQWNRIGELLKTKETVNCFSSIQKKEKYLFCRFSIMMFYPIK